MARHVTERNLRELRAQIRQRLIMADFAAEGTADDIRCLLALLNVEARPDFPDRSRLKTIATELRRGLFQARHPTLETEASPSLLDWIDRYLLTLGPDLLVTEAGRFTLMARQRDSARRANHDAQGFASSHLVLPRETWQGLRVLQSQFEKALGFKPTRGQVIARLIEDRVRSLSETAAHQAAATDADASPPAAPDPPAPAPVWHHQPDPSIRHTPIHA
jgi:hypothetical protein